MRKKERFVLGKRTFRSQKSKHFVLRIILCNGSFVVDTVESVVNWFMAGNSYKECVFSAINSGKSSDAVGALTGLLAGIYYGLELKNGVKGFETMESYIDSFIQYLNHPTL